MKNLQTRQAEIKAISKIDSFYFDTFIPLIPLEIYKRNTNKTINKLLTDLYQLVGKCLVHERSILDNKLAYKNLSITHTKKTKKESKV